MRKPPVWVNRVANLGQELTFASSGLPHTLDVRSRRHEKVIHVDIGYGEFDLPLVVAEAIADIVVALRKKGKANG